MHNFTFVALPQTLLVELTVLSAL